MKKSFIIAFVSILAIVLLFRTFCGIFVIQPIGALPEGATIVYWRAGLDLNLSFIESADSLLEKWGAGVSILGRGIILATIAKPIKEKEIIRLGYSEAIYLWSTGGKKFVK